MKLRVMALLTALFVLILPISAHAGQFVQPRGNVSTEELLAINTAYDRLPQNIKNLVKSSGYQYYITDEDINALIKDGEAYSCNGITSSNPAYVMVRNKTKNVTNDKVLYHETGHVINNILEKYSNTPEWREIYRTEYHNGVTSAKIANSSEWFAESVALYIMYPYYFAKFCPQSYTAVSALLNSL